MPKISENIQHIYNRGVDKRKTFLCDQDFHRFLRKLDDYKIVKSRFNENTALVEIEAFCLIPNHYHLILREVCEDGIPLFMQRIGTSYTKYFNHKYHRTGSLFGSKYKSQQILTQSQLEQTMRYVHLNPLSTAGINWKEGITDPENAKRVLVEYPWSSLYDYQHHPSYRRIELNPSDRSVENPKYIKFLTKRSEV